MRNDARPVGEDVPPSPIGGPEKDAAQVVNREPQDNDAENKDPTMPADDSTLNIKI
jgi:hypothetical protein